MAVSRMADQVGRVLGGRYRLLAPVGAGASAQVYVADDVTLRRRVAVKILHPALAADPAFLRRFRAEAQAAAALSHPNVMAVYDWGEEADLSGHGPYLVMEYLGGGSLRAMLDTGHLLSPSQALVITLEAARGLEYAHRRGFVHRDIKPANLLFDEEGRLRIADFGLARAIAEAAWTEPEGVVLGTARYASPEQARGVTVDGKTDVYSLALVAVEAVTGTVPFTADTTMATLMARQNTLLPVPDALGPLRTVLERAGRPDPGERYDATEMARALVVTAEQLPRPAPLQLVVPTLEDTSDDLTMTASVITADRDRRPVAPSRPPVDDSISDESALVPLVGGRRRRPLRRLLVGLVVVALVAGGVIVGRLLTAKETPTHVVPQLVHRAENDAIAAIGASGWAFQEVRTRQDGTLPGEVVAQSVAAGVKLKEGEPFVLTISDGPTLTAVPDLSGKAEPDARAALAAVGLAVGNVTQANDEAVPAGVVLRWDSPGAQLPKGSAIGFVVSAGPVPRSVPNVVGQPYDTAAAAITGVQLKPVRQDAFDDNVPAGSVISIQPVAGSQVARDSQVVVVVSKGPDLVEVPSIRGAKRLDDANAVLTAAGLVPGQVFGPSRGKPFDTNPPAGSKVKRGSTVDIYLR